MYATVYEVTRHYGGPEEGGWWFNWHKKIKSFRIPKAYLKKRNASKADQFLDKIKKQFSHLAWGNISSVNGGVKISVYTEDIPGENQDTETPHYE